VSEGLARVISIGSIVFTIASLALAVVFARKKTRIRVGFDLARSVIGVLAILVMATVTNVSTSTLAVLLAVVGGLALGFGQGSRLEFTEDEKGFHARRNPAAIALWGFGIVIMQAAGLASRAGAVRLGQTIAWFSVCLGIGLMAGRTGPLRRTVAGASVAASTVLLLVPLAAFISTAEAPAFAQVIQLTDDEVCDLIPATRNRSPGLMVGYNPFTFGDAYNPSDPGADRTRVDTAIAGCQSSGYFDYTGLDVDFFVYLFASEEEALAQWQNEVTMGNSWYEGWYAGSSYAAGDSRYDPTVDYNLGGLNEFGVSGAWFSVAGAADHVVIKSGPFLLHGVADNLGFDLGEKGSDGFRRPTTMYEELVDPMVETVRNIEILLTAEEPPVDSGSEGDGVPPTVATAATTPTGESDSSQAAEDVLDAGVDPPIDPEEAAAQAIAGLIAAAAIGIITWAEASAEIGRILGGLDRNGSSGTGVSVDTPPVAPLGPFIDPLDQQPLEVDPATGMVFWPWDGGDGHWVDPSEVPSLLDDWNRELDAETARRVAGHDAGLDQNSRDLHDSIDRSQSADAARLAGDRARLDAFDRRVAAAERWMEEADVDSLDQLDRIRERVANQGFATDEDIERAGRIADRSRVWADTRRQWDADDWTRITNNRNTVLEVAGKGVSIMIDPTKGVVSGAIWGGMESWHRGDSAATVVGNAVFEATVFRGSHAVGTWAPGRAAVGRIGWGATGGSITTGVETLARGGSLEDAWHASQVGFVVGGLGGVAEEAVTVGARPTPDVPTIRSQRGGPRVGYDAPSTPTLRPPERGGVGSMPRSTPPLVVEPGGPGPHYDQPLSPRHVDPGDPRFVPEGTPASEVHTPPSDWSQPPPQVIEPQGPLGGRPPTEPPSVSPADVADGRIPGSVSDWSQPPPQIIEPQGPLGGRPPSTPPPVSPVDVFDGPSTVLDGPPPPTPLERPPLMDLPDRPPPPQILPEEGAFGGRPPSEPPSVSPVDALDGPPLRELPDSAPPRTPEQLLEGARPTRATSDILDDMMNQPSHPAGSSGPVGVQEWQPGYFPDAQGRTMIDSQGRVLVHDRHIGNVNPETGTLVNLDGDPMRVAIDHRGVPQGYVEQPSSPPGMEPAYNSRGELAGHVDSSGRADIGGERVPVAFDSEGNLVPYEGSPRQQGSPVEHLPPESLRGQTRLPGSELEPTTGALTEPPAGPTDAAPPATGQMEAPVSGAADGPIDYSPYGRPIEGGDGAAPIGLSELDRSPRIPVLDENGRVSHLVEPGPREIHYDQNGNPFFVQRQHPVSPTPMRDINIADLSSVRDGRMMPTPEVFDATEAWHQLGGEGAPPLAPDVIPPSPPGGDPP